MPINMKSLKLYLLQAILLLFIAILPSEQALAQRKKKDTGKSPTPEQISQEVEYLFVEAEKLFILKNYSQATEVLNKCLSLDPRNDVVYYKLAEISNTTEQFSSAAEYIDKALEINSTNKYYFLLAVDIQTNLGNLKQSAYYYEQLINTIPSSESYLFNLAATYIYLKEYDKALLTYDKAEDAFGLSENVSFQRQKIYLQQNKLDEAISEGKRLLEKFPDNPKYSLLLVEVLSTNNRLDEATQQLNTLLEKRPDFSAARLQLADIYWKQQNFNGFEDELILAFKDGQLNINAKINTMMKYMAFLPNQNLQPLFPKLVTILTEAHEDDSNAYLIAGDVYSTLLDKQLIEESEIEAVKTKAAEAYSNYVSIEPSNFSVWQNLLNLELQLNQQENLAKHAEESLELFPNQAWLYLINGIVEVNNENNREAAVMFEMGSKRSTGNKGLLVIFYSYLGDVYNDLEEYEKSGKAYESVLELDPLNFTVLNNYSYYLSLRGEKLDEAKKMSTTLIRNNPDNNTFLDTYAWVHYTIGDYEEAKRIFKKIIASNVDDGVYYDHYGDTLYMLGEEDEAVNQWKRAKELDKNIENIDQKINQRRIIQ